MDLRKTGPLNPNYSKNEVGSICLSVICLSNVYQSPRNDFRTHFNETLKKWPTGPGSDIIGLFKMSFYSDVTIHFKQVYFIVF